ncbi:DUF397 domain-containing protein [Streptomyces sp. NPDC049577]|uniref:DUF397 domain-containing protein n=1 Tax=Streptomyces sp. NPDC049577 TaxID=3155153 RepID=UPI003445E0A2
MSNDRTWFKSSYSDDEGAECVEVAIDRRAVRVRDSKLGGGPRISLPPSAWTAFIARIPELRASRPERSL